MVIEWRGGDREEGGDRENSKKREKREKTYILARK